jgi:hypothetical protein
MIFKYISEYIIMILLLLYDKQIVLSGAEVVLA